MEGFRTNGDKSVLKIRRPIVQSLLDVCIRNVTDRKNIQNVFYRLIGKLCIVQVLPYKVEYVCDARGCRISLDLSAFAETENVYG